MIIKALSKLTIELDHEVKFRGNLVRFIADVDKLDMDKHFGDKPPKEQMHISLGDMYVLDVTPEKTTLSMDADVKELYALFDMLIDGAELIPQIPEELKMILPLYKAMIPSEVVGVYTAVYPDGEVTVDGNAVKGSISVGMGLNHLHAFIAKQEEERQARLAEYSLDAEIDTPPEGTSE
jgi:hypothetical protein